VTGFDASMHVRSLKLWPDIGRRSQARVSFANEPSLGLKACPNQQAAKFIDLPCKVYRLCLQDFHRMAAMALIFQFYDPLVKIVQFLLQSLDCMLDRETRSRNYIGSFSGLCPRRKQVAGSSPPCGHGFSKSHEVE
jgi:hypothetical protein